MCVCEQKSKKGYFWQSRNSYVKVAINRLKCPAFVISSGMNANLSATLEIVIKMRVSHFSTEQSDSS